MKTVLITDNDVLFVEFFAAQLEERGYRVFKALDGQKALALMEENAIDLLFVDIYMPGMDGREVIRRAREKFSAHEMKIIAVSGAARETVEGLDELDFDAFLQKSPLEKMSGEVDSLMDSMEKLR